MTCFLLRVLACWHGANGFLMLLAPRHWYGAIPGVPETGAFNAHFVADIGIAFLACAAALFVAARSSGATRAALLLAPALFLGGHALLHLLEPASNATDWIRDAVAILIPGLAPGAIAVAIARSGKPA